MFCFAFILDCGIRLVRRGEGRAQTTTQLQRSEEGDMVQKGGRREAQRSGPLGESPRK